MGKKPKSEVITPAETMELMRQQQRMNNPSVNNMFGSTSTEFGDDDVPTITQTMSPQMQALVQQQLDFAGQGASQYKGGNNQGLESMFNNFANRVGTGGMTSKPPSFAELLTKPDNAPIQPIEVGSLPSRGAPPPTGGQLPPNQGNMPPSHGSIRPNILQQFQERR